MNKISISRCVSGAWDLTTKNWQICIVLLVVYVISMSIGAIGKMSTAAPNDIASMLDTWAKDMSGWDLLSNILLYAAFAGICKMAINGYNGLKADLSAFRMPVTTYVRFVLGILAHSILTLIGTFLFIIPGIYIGVRLMFVPVILLDEPETGFVEAFKKSWAMTAGSFWNLFLLFIAVILINIVGAICCGVGLLFTGVMTLFMYVIAYYQLNDGNAAVTGDAFGTI